MNVCRDEFRLINSPTPLFDVCFFSNSATDHTVAHFTVCPTTALVVTKFRDLTSPKIAICILVVQTMSTLEQLGAATSTMSQNPSYMPNKATFCRIRSITLILVWARRRYRSRLCSSNLAILFVTISLNRAHKCSR